jgi:hypothetical protein
MQEMACYYKATRVYLWAMNGNEAPQTALTGKPENFQNAGSNPAPRTICSKGWNIMD